MKVLLDTNAALWMAAEPAKLRAAAWDLLEAADTIALFSAASAWEIAIKWSRGKLALPRHPRDLIPSLVQALELSPLPVSQLHAAQVAELPDHHRDPFDRLLVAQAQIEGIPIVTSDVVLAKYDVEIIPAA